MYSVLLADFGTLPFADAIDVYRRIGLLVVPTIVFLTILCVFIWKGHYRGGVESGKRTVEELRGKAPHPIATSCPGCGSTEYSNAKDQEGAMIVFYDRICSRCGTRYTPPTPKWLAVALLPLGIVVAAAGGVSVYLCRSEETPAMFSFASLAIFVAGVCLVMLGAAKMRVRSARSSHDNTERDA